MDRAVEHDPGDSARDARRLDHDHRDAGDLPRHPPRSAGAGEQLLPAVDDPRLHDRRLGADRQPRAARGHLRAGADLQPRVRDLHGGVADPGRRLDDRSRRRRLPDHLPDRPGHRRRLPDGELGGDPHRRVPAEPARDGARDQQHRRRQRDVRRARDRGAAGADQLAPGVPDLGSGRAVRDGVGLPEPQGAEHAQEGPDRLVGQRDVRARTDLPDGRGHLRDPALRRARHRLGQPARAGAGRRSGSRS